MPVINSVAARQDEMTAWRRHLHQHPELGFQEVETAALRGRTAARARGDEVHTGIGETGVVRRAAAGGQGPAIGLCAPTWTRCRSHEDNELRRTRSQHAGTMHACGHDGHTAMLLGAARYLAETPQLRRHRRT